MIYKLCDGGKSVYCTNENGQMVSMSVEADEYKQWLVEGNTPLDEDVDIAAQKQIALDTITVTTASGKVFDGREKDVPLMSGAIQAAEVLGLTEHQWKLHDNTVAVVTLSELKEALAFSMQAIGAIKVS